MRLSSLSVNNLRVLSEVEVGLEPGLNVFVGPNGSGKTSLLEGVHVLGSGRSFRTRRLNELCKKGCDRLLVRGTVENDLGEGRSLGVEKSPEGVRIRFANEEIRRASELARHLPLVVVTPDTQRMLTDGASLRRQYLDWLLFHVEPAYLEIGQRYQKLLKQRNAELRQGGMLAEVWGEEMSPLAEQIHCLREAHLSRVLPVIADSLSALLSFEVTISYQPGWEVARPLSVVLSEQAVEERTLGYTRWGPHRADLRFTVERRSVQNTLSRGEAKLFVVGLMVGQAVCLVEEHSVRPVILVDELASELDKDSRDRIFRLLSSLRAQTFITTVSQDLVSQADSSLKLFHVERGSVTEML